MRRMFYLFATCLFVLTAGAMWTACSSDDKDDLPEVVGQENDDYNLPKNNGEEELTPLYSSTDLGYNIKTHVEPLGNWTVCLDDEGHCWWATFYETTEPIEKWHIAPSSPLDLNGKLFNLDDDHSLKKVNEEQYPDYGEYSRRQEYYHEYYRGVPVLNGDYSFFYLRNSQEEHIIHGSGYFITFDSLDAKPAITGNQAKQIFSEHLKVPIEETWTASLYAREYHVRVEGETFRREQRLIYYVIGPTVKIIKCSGKDQIEGESNQSAEIDAHTGQIVFVSIKNFFTY